MVATRELFTIFNEIFVNLCNILFDCPYVFNRKQLKRQPVEKKWSPTRTSLNCGLEDFAELVIHKCLAAKMLHGENQQETPIKPSTTKQTMELAVNTEVGNQAQISMTWTSIQPLNNISSSKISVDQTVGYKKLSTNPFYFLKTANRKK